MESGDGGQHEPGELWRRVAANSASLKACCQELLQYLEEDFTLDTFSERFTRPGRS